MTTKSKRTAGSFRAAMEGGEGSLYVYSDIGANWWGDGLTAKQVVDAIEDLKKQGAKTLNVHINSGGGDVFEGAAIHSAIRAFNGKRTVTVDGIAASAASVVMMAGDAGEIRIAPAAMVMVHNPSGFCMGQANDMRKCGDTLDKVRASMLDVYANRTGLSQESLAALCDAETWMTAAEAKANGFVDKVLEREDAEEEEEEDDVMEDHVRSIVAKRFKHAPPEATRLLASAHPAARMAASADAQSSTNHKEKQVMMTPEEQKAFDAVKAENERLAAAHATMTETLTLASKEAQDVLAATGMKTPAEAVAHIEGLKVKAARVDELTAAAEKVEAQKKADTIKSMLDAAEKDGRLPPTKRNELSAAEAPAFAKDVASLKAFLDCLPKAIRTQEDAPIVPKETNPKAELNDDEMKMAAQLGIDPAKIKEYKASQKK